MGRGKEEFIRLTGGYRIDLGDIPGRPSPRMGAILKIQAKKKKTLEDIELLAKLRGDLPDEFQSYEDIMDKD